MATLNDAEYSYASSPVKLHCMLRPEKALCATPRVQDIENLRPAMILMHCTMRLSP